MWKIHTDIAQDPYLLFCLYPKTVSQIGKDRFLLRNPVCLVLLQIIIFLSCSKEYSKYNIES